MEQIDSFWGATTAQSELARQFVSENGLDEMEPEEELLEDDSIESMIGMEAGDLAFEVQLEEALARHWAAMVSVTKVSRCPPCLQCARSHIVPLAQTAEADTDFTRHDLPIARVRRIMRQDACDDPRVRGHRPARACVNPSRLRRQ